MSLASTGPSSPSTPPSFGVAQKVSRSREPPAHVGVPQAVAQHLHGLVERPLGPLIDRVRQQRPRPHQSAQLDARHAQSPRRRRHAAAFVEKLSLDGGEANGKRRLMWLHWSLSPSRRSRSTSWRSRIIPLRHETVSDHRRSSRRPGLGCNLAGPPSSSSRNFRSRAIRAASRSTGEPFALRYRTPQARQHRQHFGLPSWSLRTRARPAHCVQTKKLHEPPLRSLRCTTRTSRLSALSPSPKQTTTPAV